MLKLIIQKKELKSIKIELPNFSFFFIKIEISNFIFFLIFKSYFKHISRKKVMTNDKKKTRRTMLDIVHKNKIGRGRKPTTDS